MDNLGGPVEVGLRFPREKVRVRERGASQVALVVKNPPASVGDIRDVGLIPGSGRLLGGGRGNPLQFSCLENSVDREPGRLQSIGLQRAGHN